MLHMSNAVALETSVLVAVLIKAEAFQDLAISMDPFV